MNDVHSNIGRVCCRRWMRDSLPEEEADGSDCVHHMLSPFCMTGGCRAVVVAPVLLVGVDAPSHWLV